MIASDLRSGVEQLGDMIAAASTIIPFTGAGISTECGIPDFRSPGGVWTRNRPIPFDEFVASKRSAGRSLAAALCDGDDVCRGQARARPPRAGFALSRRQDSRDHHPEHRQSASGLGLRRRSCRRAARQHHLCPLHRMRPGLRSLMGEAAIRRRTAAPPTAPCATSRSRPRPFRSGRRCRKTRWRARPSLLSIATCSLRSDRRWWSGQPPGFR